MVTELTAEQKKRLALEWKLRKPAYGVVSLRCAPTGETFLATTNDVRRGLNRHTFQLEAGAHPNRRLQGLWDAHGRDAFELGVAAELDYDDPTADQSDALDELLQDCLARIPGSVTL